MADPITAVSRHCLQRRLGVLSKDDRIAVGRVICLQLDLWSGRLWALL